MKEVISEKTMCAHRILWVGHNLLWQNIMHMTCLVGKQLSTFLAQSSILGVQILRQKIMRMICLMGKPQLGGEKNT